MGLAYLSLSVAFLVGSIIAYNVAGLLLQASLFIIALGCCFLSFNVDKS